MRNDQGARDELISKTGRHMPAQDISSQMAKYVRRSLVLVLEPGARGRPGRYELTEQGRRYLDGDNERKVLRRKPSDKPNRLGEWRRPVVRSVEQQGISLGFDQRYQCAPDFEGGEFVAEWKRLRGLA